MKLKELQAYQYSLKLYEEFYNAYAEEKKYYDLIFKLDGKLISADSFEFTLDSKGVVFPKQEYFVNESYLSTNKSNFINGDTTELFTFLRDNLINTFKHNLLDYRRDFDKNSYLLLDRIKFYLSKLNIENTKSFNESYLYNVRCLELNIDLPFICLSGNEDFEMVSLIERTVSENQ